MDRGPVCAARRAAIVCGFAVIALVAQGALAAPEASTFATPEAAVEHFVRSMAAEDFDGALEVFAVDDYAAHVDFAKTAKWLGSFVARIGVRGPSQYKLYRRINAVEARRDAANQSLNFVVDLLVGESGRAPADLGAPDVNTAARVLAMDMARLRALEIVRIDPPRASVTRKPVVLAMFKEQAAAEGADDATERIALMRLAGQHYGCGFRLLKYGNTWRIKDLHSDLASDTPGRLGVSKTTPEEFEALTK